MNELRDVHDPSVGRRGVTERREIAYDESSVSADVHAFSPGAERDMIRISQLAASVKPSATLAAGAKARQLKAEGVKVFDFSLGEPDFNTPEHICDAADKAALGGQTHYTPAGGTAELKAAICRWYKKFHGFECAPEKVIVSNGAKHSIHNALAATVGPGDEVIIPTPYWVSYCDLVSMTGATPVLVPTTPESGFKMTPAQLKAALTPRTRLLMLNSPCNPTGTVYTRAELEALVDRRRQQRRGDPQRRDLRAAHLRRREADLRRDAAAGLADRTITISGASKSYAMTGWRMGWAIAPGAVVKAMDTSRARRRAARRACRRRRSSRRSRARRSASRRCARSSPRGGN